MENEKKVTFHSKVVEDKDWFGVAKSEVSYQKYDGTMCEPAEHIYMIGREGVSVVLHDVAADVFLLIEEFRIGSAEKEGWLTGVVTGGLEEGEEPILAAVRECEEEAAVKCTAMDHLLTYYPEPGFSTHVMHAFVGRFEHNLVKDEVNGLDEEGEDIKPILVTREKLLDMLSSGEIINGTAKIALSHYLLHGVNRD